MNVAAAAVLVAALATACPAAAAWKHTGPLSTAGARTSDAAVDARGDMLLVWQQLLPDGTAVIEASTRRSGGRFSKPALLLHSDGFPRLAYNARGDVLLSIEARNAGNCEALGACAERVTVYSGRIDGRFGDPAELTDDARAPVAFAIGPKGDAVASWSAFVPDIGTGDVVARRRAPGSGWRAPELLAKGLGQPAAAIDAAGRTVVTWADLQTGDLHVFRAGRATPFAPLPVSAGDTRAVQAGVALAPSGAGALYWSSGSTSPKAPLFGVLARSGADFTHRVKFTGAAGGRFASSAGGLLAFWSELDRASDIHRTIFDPYAAIGTPRRMGPRRAVATHGTISGAGIDANGRATLAVMRRGAFQVVDRKGSHRTTQTLVKRSVPINSAFALAPTGHGVVTWLQGKPPQDLRLYAAWH